MRVSFSTASRSWNRVAAWRSVPIALPRVLVETVSAGGGSIAWIDDGGALRVGPRSAGAVPGPVAFGRGGTQPTVTDAHISLGRLDAARLSGGVTLDATRRRSVPSPGARGRSSGATPERTAEAIIAIADAAMARALRRVSVERGIDPRARARSLRSAVAGRCTRAHWRNCSGCGLDSRAAAARRLLLSALGLAIAPERRDAAASVMRAADTIDQGWFGARLDSLALRAANASAQRLAWHARVRYAGQGHELDISCAPGDDGAALAVRFGAAHAGRYGFTLARPVEVVAIRVAATGDAVDVTFTSAATATRTVAGPHSRKLSPTRRWSSHLHGRPVHSRLADGWWSAHDEDRGPRTEDRRPTTEAEAADFDPLDLAVMACTHAVSMITPKRWGPFSSAARSRRTSVSGAMRRPRCSM